MVGDCSGVVGDEGCVQAMMADRMINTDRINECWCFIKSRLSIRGVVKGIDTLVRYRRAGCLSSWYNAC